MSDSNDSGTKDTLKVLSPNRLQLTKTVEGGRVKQSFQHGRSKTVTVEVRKTRTFTSGTGGKMVEVRQAVPSVRGAHGDEDSGRMLTEDERQARLNALRHAEEESRQTPDRPAARRTDAYRVVSPERTSDIVTAPRPARASGETSGSKAQDAGAQPVPAEPGRSFPPGKKLGIAAGPRPAARAPRAGEEGEEESERIAREAKAPKGKVRREEPRRNSGKITVTQALGNYEERMRSLASIRRQREKAKKALSPSRDQEKIFRDVVIPEAITVQELANRMAERAVDVIKILMKLGMMATVTETIDADTAELVATEMGHKVRRVAEADVENVLDDIIPDDDANLLPRPPVVTVMGHVDHGKTSLLDALRSTDVVAKEAGGITQHIGAYQVELTGGQRVTFLDTPGHEAFTAMRARGAKATDIVVLVVAADDGIMEQTKEAISHAKAADVPIIVAVNKIDKPGADATRVKTELMSYELVPEEFGGDTIVVEVSAKQKTNLEKLVEAILLQSEVLELKANPNRAARGVVIEAKLDQGRGVVATVLIQKGTLRVGDVVVSGGAYGRVRGMTDDKGRTIEEALPGMPAAVLGLTSAPEAGDSFSAVESEKTAREIAEYRQNLQRTAQALTPRSLEKMFSDHAGTSAKELPLVIKADVRGSVEAIAASVAKYSGDEVAVKVLHTGVGAISESDITLAHATGAMIIGFNVRAGVKAKEMAAKQKVDIRYYSIIYNVVDDIKAAVSGMLSPTLKENFLGYAEIRQIFNMSKAGKVAGCMVTEGVVKRGAKVRLLRDNVVIHEGTLKTLKRFKDEVKEVKAGMECGMAFENYEDIREGDMIECFEVEQVARTI